MAFWWPFLKRSNDNIYGKLFMCWEDDYKWVYCISVFWLQRETLPICLRSVYLYEDVCHCQSLTLVGVSILYIKICIHMPWHICIAGIFKLILLQNNINREMLLYTYNNYLVIFKEGNRRIWDDFSGKLVPLCQQGQQIGNEITKAPITSSQSTSHCSKWWRE